MHGVLRSHLVTSRSIGIILLLALTIVRLASLHLSVVDLYFDEAQYWLWAREPAFGYFSKPPLLAWIIAVVIEACGNGEACVRSASPLFYLGTSLLAYAIADLFYGRQTAFWTALGVALATGVSFSSRIISTDVPLLFFWTLALHAYLRLLLDGSARWSIVLGLALGAGLLAKYAMIYFLLGIALAALFDKRAKDLMKRPALWIALLIAAALLSPNIIWNVTHGLMTFNHTVQNIHSDGFHFTPLKGIEFIGSQFFVMGPIIFGILLALLTGVGGLRLCQGDISLLAFAIAPLAPVTLLAFTHGAYANWAAPAFIPVAVVATAVMVRHKLCGLLTASLGIGITVQVTLVVADSMADRLTIPALGTEADIYRRTLVGRDLGAEVGRLARNYATVTIVGEEHYEVSLLLYYLRDKNMSLYVWPTDSAPQSHYDFNYALTEDVAQPILFVSQCPAAGRLQQYYAEVAPLGQFVSRTGPTSRRIYFAFKLAGPRKAIGRLSRCE
jgi:4-amino-4-deoxy-L-arabinose transferase-like glycosyltransferase